MKFNYIKLYYKEIFFNLYPLEKEYDLKEIEALFGEELNNGKIKFSAELLTNTNVLIIDIHESYLLDYLSKNFQNILLSKNYKIIKYLEVLDFVSNNDYIDTVIPSKKFIGEISYAAIIADRNLEIALNLFINIQKNQKNLNLIVYFLLRDLIENIKLYLYFVRGSIKEEVIKNQYGTFLKEEKDEKIINHINNVLLNENSTWGFDVREIIKNNQSIKIWENELKRIENINNICNEFIHKNGFVKIQPRYFNLSKVKITIDDIFFCLKFFLTIIICYDGKVLSSSDYVDYIEAGEEPPLGCQSWVAPVVRDFVIAEYSNEDLKKLDELTYMDFDDHSYGI